MSNILVSNKTQRNSKPTDKHSELHVQDQIEAAISTILKSVGENPTREGLLNTPSRVYRMYKEMFSGIGVDPKEEITVTFKEDHDEVILVRDIPFYSMCEHHLVPFFGVAHVAYLPKDGVITGLSKLARVVDCAARRPQVQERMTTQIANAVNEKLDPLGVAVVLEAEHLCMTMRGVKKPGSKTVTSVLKGIFKEDQAARQEVLSLIKLN